MHHLPCCSVQSLPAASVCESSTRIDTRIHPVVYGGRVTGCDPGETDRPIHCRCVLRCHVTAQLPVRNRNHQRSLEGRHGPSLGLLFCSVSLCSNSTRRAWEWEWERERTGAPFLGYVQCPEQPPTTCSHGTRVGNQAHRKETVSECGLARSLTRSRIHRSTPDPITIGFGFSGAGEGPRE